MKKLILIVTALNISVASLSAQKRAKETIATPEGYKFTNVVSLPATPVKDQRQLPPSG
jgi:hypothetical protein